MHDPKFDLIQTEQALASFYSTSKDVPWLGFDTEFVGEKRFNTLLCLIQVITQKGRYLIDPLALKSLDPLLEIIQDPKIVKITHAGENDYRLLHNIYGITPNNVFDTQIAAAFTGYKYPVSFRRLVEGELRISLDKGYAVANWERRPLQPREMKYAMEDVIPLPDLWHSLESKLLKKDRLRWAEEEFAKLETHAYYAKDPNQEIISHNLMRSLNQRERLFLLRMLTWRRETAEAKDYSREMVMPSKIITHIIKSIGAGKDALKKNRHIPDKITDKYGSLFMEFIEKPATPEEKKILAQIPRPDKDDDIGDDIVLEMLYLLVKYQAINQGITPSLVMPKNMVDKFRNDDDLREAVIGSGWRREMLGDSLVKWLENIDRLELDIQGGKIEIRIGDN